MKPLAIFDGNSRKRLCYLHNAYNISYSKTTSSLWTATFTLPYGDFKNEYCVSMNFVEVWDVDGSGKDKYVGLFRIMPAESQIGEGESSITYNLEHVLGTLLDDTMIGWEEIGNLGVYTNTVINYILGRQTVKRWVLGVCDYRHQYLYGWQDENLLSALYSVTNAFIEEDYRWEYDTKNYPWTLSLKQVSGDAVTDIRYRKNINGIHKTADPTNLTTRLYCYGYGQSDNRLTIKSVNNNLPYIDSPNISKFGLITRVWTDERFTHEESLLQTGKSMLKTLEEPIVSYEIDVATIRKAADLEAGDMVRVVDEGVDMYTRVVEVSKDDVSGAPLIGKVVLANKTGNIAQSVADMADRQRIATTYSQGAETLFADSLYDNADALNPAELSFTVPDNAVHINEILFSAKLTAFRAYSKATQGGGATSTTTNSGGGTSTSSGDGGSSQTTSGSGGSSQATSSNGGGVSQTTSTSNQIVDTTHGSANVQRGMATSTSAGDPSHTHQVEVTTFHEHQISISGHNHNMNIASHSHTVNVPSHTHSVSIPSHTHSVNIPSHSHNFSIPNHTHDIQYGIYKGSSASGMTVQIDGITVGTYSSSVNNVNLIAYMSKNANGEVLRGQHTIRITPNALTRVECAIQIRLFTNARGAGQY